MASLFKRILCPVDLDGESLAALVTARRLAEQNDATVSLVHAVSFPLPRPLEPAPEWERTVNARLAKIAQDHFGNRVRWNAVIVRGDAGNAIIRAAGDLDAGLIVMATHGHTGINRLLLGSVAAQVVRGSPVPVLTVRPERRRKRPSPRDR
jgi:universal stress protein A